MSVQRVWVIVATAICSLSFLGCEPAEVDLDGCIPSATCEAVTASCGSLPDGCGGTLECGTCGEGSVCEANRCVSSCTPTTCDAQGAMCGSVDDGCGTALHCGACGEGQACSEGSCIDVCPGPDCEEDPGLHPTWGLPLWRDEFDGDAVKPWWFKMDKPYAAGNSESQWYRPENLEVSNGTLKIISRREDVSGPVWQAPAMSFASPDGVNRATPRTGLPEGARFFTSGLINTREGTPATYFPLFARFEIRARVPHGQGLLPAFWLRRNGGAGYGEVDIMESFGNYRPGQGKFSLHFPNTTGVNRTQQGVHFEDADPEVSGWHTWAVEITPTTSDPQAPIRFQAFLDNVEFGDYVVDDAPTIQMLRDAPSDATWDIALNTAVGGKWVGEPDQQLGYLPMVHRCSRSQGRPDGDNPLSCDLTDLFFAQLPAVFEIDYVRVWDLP